MAQRPNSYPINPTSTSGTDLATLMNADEVAESSNNSGNTRPSYLTAGGIWTQTVTGGTYNLMLYDGTSDHVVGDNQGGHIVANPAAGSPQAITAGAKTDIALSINGAASQSADLLRVGTNKLVVKPTGAMVVNGLAGTGTRIVTATSSGTLGSDTAANLALQGPQGATGATGPAGPAGAKGATGATGPAGPGITVYTQTADPGTAAKPGDIWIK